MAGGCAAMAHPQAVTKPNARQVVTRSESPKLFVFMIDVSSACTTANVEQGDRAGSRPALRDVTLRNRGL